MIDRQQRTPIRLLNFGKERDIKALVVSIALLFAAGCESVPMGTGGGSTGGNTRYECYTYVGSKHVLTLPVAPLNSDVGMVNVTFHGEQLEAKYQRSGLTQLWIFEDSLYIKVDPDLTAGYFDFRGADEGESRKPDAVFECKKRR